MFYCCSSDWKWLLNSFADRVADKEYQKTDYQIWRKLKNLNEEVKMYWWSSKTIIVEASALDTDEKEFFFEADDGSFGSYLAEHWLNDTMEEKKYYYTDAITGTITGYTPTDWGETAKAAVIDYTGNVCQTINGSTIKIPSIDISLDHLATKGAVDGVCDKIDELKAEISTKLDKAEYYNDNNEKEKKSMNMFKGFEFGKVDGNKVRMSMYGLAVRNQAGTWVSYDVNTGNVIDVDPFNMDGSQFMYKMPVALNQVSTGDMIIHNCKPVYVTAIDENGKLVVIDIFDGEEKMILPTRNMFGFNFVTKVVSLMDMAGMGKPNADNPFGNMWMLALMNDNKDFGMKDFLMLNMMTGDAGAQNPMMMMMLMGDKGQDNDLLMAMAMSGMFNQKQ